LHCLAFLLLLPLALPLRDTQPGGAQVTYNHALQLFQRGYLAVSQQEAASAARQYQLSDPAWARQFQLLQADSMLYRGMYEDALRVLGDYRDSAVPDDGEVEKLAIEAVALTRQQQVSAADQRLRHAETICKNVDYLACGDLLAARAILTAKVGQLVPARESFLQALSFARSHHDPWLEAGTTLNLGYIALQVDHYDEALDWSRSAYQAASARGYENFAQGAEGNLGWAYYELGDEERALEQFLAAEKTAARLGNVRSELKWLSTAGYVYHDSGDRLRAAQSYRQALDLARQINSREDIVNALEDLADISVVSGNLDEADTYIKQVNTMENAGRSRPGANLVFAMGEVAAARRQYAQAEDYFLLVRNDPAGLMATKLNAGYELANLYELQNNTAAAERMYKATLTTYEAARTQLKSEESQLPFGTNAAQIYDRYIHLLERQGKIEAALAAADHSRARTLEQNLDSTTARNFERTATLNPRQIAQRTNSTLLFYWLGEKESYLWAITPTKTVMFTLPAQQEIAALVESYRNVLLDVRDPLEAGNKDGQSLYRFLVAPAATLIGPGRPVIILSDGILSQLNFETLLVPGAGPGSQQSSKQGAELHYLIDDLTLSSAPSLAMLAAVQPVADAGQGMLLFGNPVSPGQDFPALPMFSFEMSRIETHFAPAQLSVFARQQATPAAYLASQPRRFSYIHFVSHAVASRTDPLDSAIILSNSTTQGDSYKLYARDIIQQPIDAKLVTISACYGSGTRAYAGEGLVGLSWAFLRAGAQRVIGALWEVSDDSTPRLMDSLYQGLADGESPAVALRRAKLTLLHSQREFRLPFYWAPFQLYSRR
jgi:CHAT domain-containing protein